MLDDKINRCFACAAFFCCLVAVCGESPNRTAPWEGTVESSGPTATMSTKAIRCLASLAYTYSTHYHFSVTYEDAPLIFASDVTDVTSASYRAIPSKHVYLPRGGPLTFQFAINPSTGMPLDNKQAISILLSAYSAEGYPGQYVVAESRRGLNIVPALTRDVDGREKKVVPLMDSMLTEWKGGSIAELIHAALRSISRETNQRIVLGAPLPQDFVTTPFVGDIRNVTAREAIEQATATSASSQMSWLLLYDPTFKYYVFTLYSI